MMTDKASLHNTMGFLAACNALLEVVVLHSGDHHGILLLHSVSN